ncbi:hypothetical protein Calkr_0687 [Caldicellulosiruptor acetigenus I77R1B]|uniref:Uncharacterized protein n=2 Tax=Caldicellulosiruptor acetigenus TaxID=301953 RepID=G2PT94_9FIRM|nr:hypothetical protein [Caldicellulosiruptor acetigenus]ADQ40221.1 hypothetical protein Calkr_0687 [Caldicellulosiruptor acetigenus I77R1B]AEM74253.1 hypothetical protein Calla_1657 [Caldicellulosiruptor acetigenus 6A]
MVKNENRNSEINIEVFKKYAQIFLDLFTRNIIRVKLFNSGIRIESQGYNLKKELERIDNTINLEDFINQVFYILNIARSIVFKMDFDCDNEKIMVVQEILKNCRQLEEEIKIKCTSNHDLLDRIDYDILTRRDKSDISKIVAYSVLISVGVIGNGQPNNDNRQILVELSESDIENVIKVLQEALDKLRILKIGEDEKK